MMKLYIAFLSLLILSISAFSQDTKEAKEYNENEFYGGYSYQWNNSGSGSNGFEVAYTRNVTRFFGIKADFSAAFAKSNQTVSSIPQFPISGKTKSSTYNYLGGVQVKDNKSTKRVKPFAHALVGVGNRRSEAFAPCLTATCQNNSPSFKRSESGIAGAFGGGLDIKINDKIDFRAIQVDYNPIYIKNRTDQNVRFSIGFVIK